MAARSLQAVVVDDSRFMRRLISDILADGGIEVVEAAADGTEAVEAVETARPDVVTMDVEMPGMGGLEAVERIMETRPTPILMLSAYTDDGAEVTLDALERGAVDFFAKPGGEISAGMSNHREDLVATVQSVAGADVGHAPTAPAASERPSAGTTAAATDVPQNATVVIGASTGGPTAVERVLAGLPRSANLRVLVVQHMPEAFTERFADRLDSRCEYDVREATDGDRIGDGEGLVANGGAHMVVSGYANGRLRVRLDEDAGGEGVQPSVDVTMRTAAQTIDDPLVAVMLTGMGDDGSQGVRAVADADGRVLAQDEETAVIHGMPGRAIETGCVDAVYPLDEIADGILETLREVS